ncbi:beta-propeller domain-containing protein [Paenibacillus sp. y28]|uniref:beta-propeller domain-containing protein n=1 Tax=Paenibacillus sp. y28 TaxID=3129110 RepID=UPI003015A9AD
MAYSRRRIKKWLVSAALPLLLFSSASAVLTPASLASSSISVIAFGQRLALEAPPRLEHNITFVPLRGLAEALGATVDWNEAEQAAVVEKNGSRVTLRVSQAELLKNGSAIPIEQPPRLVNGHLMVPARALSEALSVAVRWDAASQSVILEDRNDVPVVGSADTLKSILAEAARTGEGEHLISPSLVSKSNVASEGSAVNAAPQAEAKPAASQDTDSAAGKTDYSRTNTQVEGVDEGDVVKTDGQFLYQLNRERLIITSAVPANQMKVASMIHFGEKLPLYPQELYVDGNRLLVIGSSPAPLRALNPVEPVPMLDSAAPASASAASGAADADQPAAASQTSAEADSLTVPPISKRFISPDLVRYEPRTKALLFDISNREQPSLEKEVELEGHYVSSRKIGSAFYFISNKSIPMYQIMNGSEEFAVPAYRDSASGTADQQLDYDRIRYFPGSPDTNYMVIAGIDLNKPQQAASISAYIGSGQNVYATQNHLYVTVYKYPYERLAQPMVKAGSELAVTEAENASQAAGTSVIYQFKLHNGEVHYMQKGEIPGRLINQFALDEYNGYLRAATTLERFDWSGDDHSSNGMYVLDDKLQLAGKVENLAPGERIYSVRFMGGRGYMVTFRNTDPLFAIDLTNPQQPAVLGQLKIPGFSDYLHPYDENHLIGFGKETMEIPVKNSSGAPGEPVTRAVQLGMKLSLFDVSDVTKPVEQFKEIIGGPGTYSELLYNHKALLFSKENNLLAFPVTVMDNDGRTNADGSPAYGTFRFQGAYVYQVDLANGFRQKGTITHLSNEDQLKTGDRWVSQNETLERIVYIGDTLYTLSPGRIKASSLNTLAEQGELVLP